MIKFEDVVEGEYRVRLKANSIAYLPSDKEVGESFIVEVKIKAKWDGDKPVELVAYCFGYEVDQDLDEYIFLQKIAPYQEDVEKCFWSLEEITDLLQELDCGCYGCETCESVIMEVTAEIKRLKVKCGEA